MAFTLTSTAFSEGSPIPKRHTCDGEDLSPPLAWQDAPAGTQSFALIADDPDAPMGSWVHWVMFNIPPHITSFVEGAGNQGDSPQRGIQGLNDFRRRGYGGPCPPRGKPHRYYFKLYALDTTLDLRPGASKADVERAMRGHILATAQVMGTYQRY